MKIIRIWYPVMETQEYFVAVDDNEYEKIFNGSCEEQADYIDEIAIKNKLPHPMHDLASAIDVGYAGIRSEWESEYSKKTLLGEKLTIEEEKAAHVIINKLINDEKYYHKDYTLNAASIAEQKHIEINIVIKIMGIFCKHGFFSRHYSGICDNLSFYYKRESRNQLF